MARPPLIAAMFILLCSLVSTTFGTTRPCQPQTTVDISNSQALHYNGRCAVAFRNELPWTKARDFCREGKGKLIKFSSKKDFDKLNSSALKRHCYWIGLNDRQNEGERVWLDGTGTGLEYMFNVRGFTMFDDEMDCVTLCCVKIKEPWVWHQQICEMRLWFLCEFEMIPGTTPTLTLPATSNTEVVTTYAKSNFTTSSSPPNEKTQKDNSIKTSGRDGAPVLQKRQQVFRREDAFGDHPYLLAVPTETFTSWSAMQCCSRCMMMGGCQIINFNQKLHTCRLFTRRQALYEGTQDIPGWLIFLSG